MILVQEQTATAGFFVPVLGAWCIVFAGLELARRVRPDVWPAAAVGRSGRPGLDLVVALLVALAVLGLGQLWHGGLLRWRWPGEFAHLGYLLAQLLIWSPLPIALWLRRQSPATAWTGNDHLVLRLAVGLVLGAVATIVYCAARGDVPRIGEVFERAATLRSLVHAVPVYLEGVGLAFLFVRLQWLLGARAAALIPAVFFAAAHVPRALADGEQAGAIVAFFAFNTVFVATLLLLLRRHRDVASIGAAHWLTDLAIGAF